ncbi:MAG TPA: hypothetical protein VFI31_08315 [Pirellulales bacterium]|nr:hypothetical protein [Pirellulales bacterium]
MALRHDEILKLAGDRSSIRREKRALLVPQRRAVFARILVASNAAPTVGELQGTVCLQDVLGKSDRTAVTGQTKTGQLKIQFDSLPRGWEPTSICMFTPRPIKQGAFRRAGPAYGVGSMPLDECSGAATQDAVSEPQSAPWDPVQVDSLTAEQFRDLVTRDFQMVILQPRNGQLHEYDAAFESDDERTLWTSPRACHFIRFVEQKMGEEPSEESTGLRPRRQH